MYKNILLRHPDQINIAWAQKILTQHKNTAEVSGVEIQSIIQGTTTRLSIKVNHNAPEILPFNWFVKIPSMVLKSRIITAIPRLLDKEVKFYNLLSESVPLSVPPIIAAYSQFGLGSTLVMADLTELGFRPGKSADALSINQARLVVHNLAKLHAYFWNKVDLFEQNPWLNGFSLHAETMLGSLLAVPLIKRGLLLAGKLVPEELYIPAVNYAANRHKMIKALASHTKTLVHHDCHPGNFFWSGVEPGFLDWQLLRLGEGIGDIAYFLAYSSNPTI